MQLAWSCRLGRPRPNLRRAAPAACEIDDRLTKGPPSLTDKQTRTELTMFPIKNVIIMVKENHTFDNYFGAFPGTNGEKMAHAADPHPDQGHDHSAWLKVKGASGGVKQQYLVTDIPAY